MEQTDEQYMRLALREAQLAFDAGEVPIGAVLVENGRVLAKTHNLTETLHDATAHAEILAITAASEALGAKYLTQSTLYVTVEPCVMCAGACYWAKIARLVYGAPDEKYGYTVMAPKSLHVKTTVASGVLAEEAARLMKDFFKNKR